MRRKERLACSQGSTDRPAADTTPGSLKWGVCCVYAPAVGRGESPACLGRRPFRFRSRSFALTRVRESQTQRRSGRERAQWGASECAESSKHSRHAPPWARVARPSTVVCHAHGTERPPPPVRTPPRVARGASRNMWIIINYMKEKVKGNDSDPFKNTV
jgi:hypothetical protein